MENNKIFRDKSLEKLSSPEQLNQYIKVANPGVWATFIGVIVLLIGFFVFVVNYDAVSSAKTVGIAKDGIITCYLAEDDMGDLMLNNAAVLIDGTAYEIKETASTPILASEVFTSFNNLKEVNFDADTWIYSVSADFDGKDGVYDATVILDRLGLKELIFNED